MDPYIESYIYDIISNKDMSDSDIIESLSLHVSTDMMNELIEIRKDIIESESPIKLYQHWKDIHKTSVNPSANTPTTFNISNDAMSQIDPTLKSTIVKNYSLRPVTESANQIHIPSLSKNNKKEKKIRYRDNVIVTSKGERYV